jgi:protein TonB
MFSELVESVAVKKTTNTSWGMLISATVQSACLIALILVPLIYTQALPKALLVSLLVSPPAPRPTPASPQTAALKETRRPARLLNHGQVYEPRAIPPHAKIFVEPELPPETPASAGTADGDGDIDLLHGFTDDSAQVTPAPPAVQALQRIQPQRIQQGGTIQAARIINQPQPVYPVLAVQARIQGNVVLHAIIDREGSVSELQVISGDPRLVEAALDAVRQWRYQPTLLNGTSVEVETTITVSFVLGG